MIQFLVAYRSKSCMDDHFSALDGRYFYLNKNDNTAELLEPLSLESLKILLF